MFPLKANVTHEIVVEYCNVRAPALDDPDEAVMDSNPGVRLGGAVVEDADALMAGAERVVAEADAVVVVVGLNADWETEGYDRTTLALPGRTDELVCRVARANKSKRTVVVTQAGSAIAMPWAEEPGVLGIVHAWYLGNSTGEAVGDVLVGKVNPCGRMSLTFGRRLEDYASYGHFRSENGKVRYGEDLFVVSGAGPCGRKARRDADVCGCRDISISIIAGSRRNGPLGASMLCSVWVSH